MELILRVCPAPGDDAGELAKLSGWLRGELLDLDVQWTDRVPDETAELLVVQIDPKALQAVMAKVNDWRVRNNRTVEISAGGHPVMLGSPAPPVDPDGDSAEPGQELIPLERPRPEDAELAKRTRLADAALLIKGRMNIEALTGPENRRTVVFAGISSLLASSIAVLLSLVILVIARHYHGFSISTNYPIHRVYQGIVRYFVRITPPPGSSHMLLVYTVYLAVLPVLFAVVFMHLKVGSTRLVFAVLACAVFMAAPFVIAITSIRVGAVSCGSWNYPEPHSGTACYGALTSVFRIAFAVGVAGLVAPVIYLIRGRERGGGNSLLLHLVFAGAAVVVTVFRFIAKLARGRVRGDRDVSADQNVPAAVGKYLLPHEEQVITVRRHPAVLIGPSAQALAGPVAAGVLTVNLLHGYAPVLTVVWIVCLLLLIRVIWKAFDWFATYFVVTSQRMLLITGVLDQRTMMMPLSKVTDMSFRRSYSGRLLGFGAFVVESADLNQALRVIDYMPYPEQLYLEICGLIFPSRWGDGDE